MTGVTTRFFLFFFKFSYDGDSHVLKVHDLQYINLHQREREREREREIIVLYRSNSCVHPVCFLIFWL